jgi:hypothetical protein
MHSCTTNHAGITASSVNNEAYRLSQDACARRARDWQNTTIADYALFNAHRLHDCSCPAFDDLLFANRMNHAKDGVGYASACTIDTDSDIRQGRAGGSMTHGRDKRQLHTRWYQGLANLDRGGLVARVEAQLLDGADTSALRSCDRIVERDFDRYVPLVAGCGGATLSSANAVEPPELTVRGGMSTRTEMRALASRSCNRM